MGHEAVGVVEAVGADVRTLKSGDVVVMPFAYSDGTCVFCHEWLHTTAHRPRRFECPRRTERSSCCRSGSTTS
jgi:threonine dehydrogenase-like Zn-dependent dehydrogenase